MLPWHNYCCSKFPWWYHSWCDKMVQKPFRVAWHYDTPWYCIISHLVNDPVDLCLPPSWRHAHTHFGFAHRQQLLRWLKPFLKHWYVKLYELIAPHTLKWINSVIKLGHFVWNIIHCPSRIKFKDRWVVFFICDSFCWTKSPTAAGLDQEMTPCKQMETMIIPTSLRSKTLLFSHKMKDAPLKYMIRIQIMSNQRWKLYNSPLSHKPLNKFNMAAADATIIFGANSVTLKYDPMFYFTQNWFLCMYDGIVYVILKYLFIVSSHIRNIGKRTTWFC